jgi:hypothetical protein
MKASKAGVMMMTLPVIMCTCTTVPMTQGHGRKDRKMVVGLFVGTSMI